MKTTRHITKTAAKTSARLMVSIMDSAFAARTAADAERVFMAYAVAKREMTAMHCLQALSAVEDAERRTRRAA